MRSEIGDRLLVSTHNAGKLEEIADLLEPLGISVTGAAELGLPEPEETGTTFLENARIKAHAAAKATGLPALADDSGLSVDALEGAPGVYTADWAETPDGRDFGMAMLKLHDRLEEAGAAYPRRAQFRCTLVLAFPDGRNAVFPGIMEGTIVWPMRGEQGHGFDPIFQPAGHDRTFGEMDRGEKNDISHRADAFRKLMKVLRD